MAGTGVTFRREVSITTIVSIVGFLAQGAAFVWFLAALSADVEDNKKRLDKVEIAIEKQRDERDEFRSRMVRVETQLGTISRQTEQQGQLLREILTELRASR